MVPPVWLTVLLVYFALQVRPILLKMSFGWWKPQYNVLGDFRGARTARGLPEWGISSSSNACSENAAWALRAAAARNEDLQKNPFFLKRGYGQYYRMIYLREDHPHIARNLNCFVKKGFSSIWFSRREECPLQKTGTCLVSFWGLFCMGAGICKLHAAVQ